MLYEIIETLFEYFFFQLVIYFSAMCEYITSLMSLHAYYDISIENTLDTITTCKLSIFILYMKYIKIPWMKA